MADADTGAIVEDDEAQLELQLALERYVVKSSKRSHLFSPYNIDTLLSSQVLRIKTIHQSEDVV